MKIGIFLPNATFDLPGSPEVGGIETFSFTVGEALQQMGHEVILFGGQPKEGRRHRATTLTLELHPYWETKSIPDIGTRFRRLVQRIHFAWSIRKAWKRHRCDMVLLAKPFDWPVAWWWKQSRPELKTVMVFHGTDYFATDWRYYSAINSAFAVSVRTAELAYKRLGIRPALIPNPVDVDFFCPGEAKRETEDWHIVASGRLVGWKAFGHIVEAVAALRDQHGITARLSIAGTGPEGERLAARVRELKLEAQVRLCGLLDATQLRDLLRTGDLYALASIGLESFSISSLEAACVGLPLVLSDQVGLADFLAEADFARFPAGDIPAFTALLKSLYDRRRKPAWINRAARHARMRNQFAPQRIAERILQLVPHA